MKYLIILEPTDTGFSAYSPDLDGCVAAGKERQETIALYAGGDRVSSGRMGSRGDPIPMPQSEAAVVEISADLN